MGKLQSAEPATLSTILCTQCVCVIFSERKFGEPIDPFSHGGGSNVIASVEIHIECHIETGFSQTS